MKSQTKTRNQKLETIKLRMRQYPKFYQAVWTACAEIPRGKVLTYGALAAQIGSPRAARAVGRALAANPFAPTIPCHRVIAASGAMTGYSAPGGIARKRRMLIAEGVALKPASRN